MKLSNLSIRNGTGKLADGNGLFIIRKDRAGKWVYRFTLRCQADQPKHDPTFAEMVDIVFDMKRDGLRGDGKRGRWRSPLDLHVNPKIGQKPMSQITKLDIRDAIKPLWKKHRPTAEKAAQRTLIVVREAQLQEVDCDPVTVDIGIRMLGEHIHKVQHIPATPWQEVPDLHRRLEERGGPSAMCIQWIILTLVRADAAKGARVSEIEGDI